MQAQKSHLCFHAKKRGKLVESLRHIRVKLSLQVMRRLSDVSGFHVFLMFLIPQRARGWCGDELCLTTPEVYEGVRDDVLPSS